MRPSSARRRALLPAAAILLLSACGESAPTSDSAAGAGPVDPGCQRVADAARWEGVVRAGSGPTTLDEHDDYFAPTCIKVPWNKPVKLVVTNLGHMPHTVTVRGTPVDVDVDSGQTAFVTLPATKVPLQIVCTFHIDQRMFAAVIPVKGEV
jgi:Cupredoxin-like domain